MEKPYHIIQKENTEEWGKFLAKNGQVLLPMVEWIEQSKLAVDELIEVLGRAQIEAVLRLSAERVAGPPHPGKKGGAIGWHGREPGTVCLKERKLRASNGVRPGHWTNLSPALKFQQIRQASFHCLVFEDEYNRSGRHRGRSPLNPFPR